MDRLCGDAELLGFELVANATASRSACPRASTPNRRVARHHPRSHRHRTQSVPRLLPCPNAECGRWIAIVEALAPSSGISASQVGKTSWFTLALIVRVHQIARQIEHDPKPDLPVGQSLPTRIV